jgi:hypothetical protein
MLLLALDDSLNEESTMVAFSSNFFFLTQFESTVTIWLFEL